MLLVSDIRQQMDVFVAGLTKRGIADAKSILEEVISLDDSRKSLQQQQDEVLSKSNKLAKQIGGLMKEGKRDEAEQVKVETGQLKEESKSLGEQLQNVEKSLKEALYQIPNIPNEIVPAGTTEDDNEVVKQSGDIPELGEYAKPHWDLIEEFDLVDFGLGNKVTGAGFPFYKGAGARMVRAMVNYFIDQANDAGYQEVQPPVVVNEASGYATGQLPDKEGQMYHIEDTDLYLIPTAEVPLTNIYRNEIINESDFPIKMAGYTPCFRREAGSWGSHVRGLNRLHQFDKVEIVQIAHPDKSYEVLDQMVAHVEALIKSLGLPYRILRLCAGDLGFTSTITYDFEVFSAAQQKWLEVSSVSNFQTYQANRLMLRYKNKEGKKQLAHTLNGSALALPRILASILENNQKGDKIEVPEVLRPYMGMDYITK